jgi:hypothetical protein
MGSFRLTVSTLHLHRTFNFTKLVPETVRKSLHHSCTSSIKWQGISLLLRSSGIGPSFTGHYKKDLSSFHFWDQHRTGVKFNTYFIQFLQNPVFLINSCFLLLCYIIHLHLKKQITLLLPKLLSHFAEFLRYYSLNHLSILYPPTCVRFSIV